MVEAAVQREIRRPLVEIAVVAGSEVRYAEATETVEEDEDGHGPSDQ